MLVKLWDYEWLIKERMNINQEGNFNTRVPATSLG